MFRGNDLILNFNFLLFCLSDKQNVNTSGIKVLQISLCLVLILKTGVVLPLTVVDVTVQSREADIPAAEAEDSTGAEIVGPEKGTRLPSSPHSAQQTIPGLETPKLGGE